MGLRDSLKKSVRKVVDRFSGEHSYGTSELDDTPPPPPVRSEPGDSGEVKVVRAKLNRPK